jgi:hypothetical protein
MEHVLVNLLKDGTPAPGPTLFKCYVPKTDHFRHANEPKDALRFASEELALELRNLLPEQYRSRWKPVPLVDGQVQLGT